MSARGLIVSGLSAAPVKGLRVSSPSQLELDRNGVRGDRRLYLIDGSGRMVNGKRLGALMRITAALEEEGSRLTLTFDDGEQVAGPVEPGELVPTRFFSEPRSARVLLGDFSAAVSERVGESLRLVAPADGSSAVDRGAHGAVSLIARPSIAALARTAGVGEIDGRRFRMSIELDGGRAFEEDAWIGREITVGEAVLLARGHVGRCLVTTRDPETGEVDLATLDGLRTVQAGRRETTEPLALGLHGEVLRPGRVRVGDVATVG